MQTRSASGDRAVPATRASGRRGREGDERGVTVIEVVLAQGTPRGKTRHRAGSVQSSITGPLEGGTGLPSKSHCDFDAEGLRTSPATPKNRGVGLCHPNSGAVHRSPSLDSPKAFALKALS